MSESEWAFSVQDFSEIGVLDSHYKALGLVLACVDAELIDVMDYAPSQQDTFCLVR